MEFPKCFHELFKDCMLKKGSMGKQDGERVPILISPLENAYIHIKASKGIHKTVLLSLNPSLKCIDNHFTNTQDKDY